MDEKKPIQKDMTIAEIVAENTKMKDKLAGMGLFCGGCPMSQFETLEQGALGHGMNVDEILEELNSEEGGYEEY